MKINEMENRYNEIRNEWLKRYFIIELNNKNITDLSSEDFISLKYKALEDFKQYVKKVFVFCYDNNDTVEDFEEQEESEEPEKPTLVYNKLLREWELDKTTLL